MFFLIAILSLWIFFAICVFKLNNAYNNQSVILDAICDYGYDTTDCDRALKMLDNVEHFICTVLRVWDWGYTRILPEEDFELIKPYIKEK